jgi:hypothetical protein
MYLLCERRGLLHKGSRRRYAGQSRCVTHKPRRRHQIRNWRDYNKALVRRGSLTLRVEQGFVGRWPEGTAPLRRGRRRFYSVLAITRAPTLRKVYRLPPRSAR